jgi:endonuclease III
VTPSSPARSAGRVLSVLSRRYEITRFKDAHGPDPFKILIGCVISLRTKDEVTYAATERLFEKAKDPKGMLKLSEAAIAKAIYPAGFYRVKARQIRGIATLLLERWSGHVPDTIDELLELPGVGRKTANLTVTLGFGKPGICVDTHVHRIANRMGWVATKTPEATEYALREMLPRRWWIPINETLVRHGQAICKPISPLCSACPVEAECAKVGVGKRR